jgi:uncharacterized protein DUF4440
MSTELGDAPQRLVQSLIAQDTAALKLLVDPDCRIVGPKGFMIDPGEWIGVHTSGVFAQVSLELLQADVVVHGESAVRTEIQRSECRFHGEAIKGLFRVMSVWLARDGDWRLAGIQYTALAEEAAAAAGIVEAVE